MKENRPLHVTAFAAHLGAGTGAPVPMLAASDELHGQVLAITRNCDPQTQRDLYAGVFLAGETSNVSGLFEIFSMRLMERYPKARVLVATVCMREILHVVGRQHIGDIRRDSEEFVQRGRNEKHGTAFYAITYSLI